MRKIWDPSALVALIAYTGACAQHHTLCEIILGWDSCFHFFSFPFLPFFQFFSLLPIFFFSLSPLSLSFFPLSVFLLSLARSLSMVGRGHCVSAHES